MAVLIQSPRLLFAPFSMADADELFACITLPMTRFMPWEPPGSLQEFRALHEVRLQTGSRNNFEFVVRRRDSLECLGMTSLENVDAPSSELGLWLRETAHGEGYGFETVRAVIGWANAMFGKERFLYAVAEQNVSSRRIAEKLGGVVIGRRTNPKYDSVVYEIVERVI